MLAPHSPAEEDDRSPANTSNPTPYTHHTRNIIQISCILIYAVGIAEEGNNTSIKREEVKKI